MTAKKNVLEEIKFLRERGEPAIAEALGKVGSDAFKAVLEHILDSDNTNSTTDKGITLETQGGAANRQVEEHSTEETQTGWSRVAERLGAQFNSELSERIRPVETRIAGLEKSINDYIAAETKRSEITEGLLSTLVKSLVKAEGWEEKEEEKEEKEDKEKEAYASEAVAMKSRIEGLEAIVRSLGGNVTSPQPAVLPAVNGGRNISKSAAETMSEIGNELSKMHQSGAVRPEDILRAQEILVHYQDVESGRMSRDFFAQEVENAPMLVKGVFAKLVKPQGN